jgi:hypothetical protein
MTMDMDTKNGEPRAYTADECREMLLERLGAIVRHWAASPDKTDLEKMNGTVFSILVVLDGESALLPAFSLVPQPHPAHAEYRLGLGENWWPDDVNLADGELHDRWANRNK